jgi:hypothetical protein
MVLRYNEGRACDAVLRLIERRAGGRRQGIRLPQRESHKYRVEFACNICGQLYALEHTGIEPFSGHMQLDAEARRRIQPLVDRVAPLLPQTEEFELQAPLDGIMQLDGKALDRAHDLLAEWIIERAPTLPIAPIGRYLAMENSSIPGLAFPVRLHRMAPIGLSKRFYVNISVADLEQRRLARMLKALSDKCPKLYGWKAEHGARTVLILEQNDICLTNPHYVTDVLLAAEREISNPADEVYLVTTCMDPWRIFPLRVGSRSYLDVTDPEERASEVDPGELVDITQG